MSTSVYLSQDGLELWGNTSSLFITEDERALLLPDVLTSDAGRYTCRAENAVGAVTHETRLTVMVPPKLRVRDIPARKIPKYTQLKPMSMVP